MVTVHSFLMNFVMIEAWQLLGLQPNQPEQLNPKH